LSWGTSRGGWEMFPAVPERIDELAVAIAAGRVGQRLAELGAAAIACA
jgi:hypothetical protein